MKLRFLLLFVTASMLSATSLAEPRLQMRIPFEGKSEIQLQVSKDIRVQIMFEPGTVSALYYGGKTRKIVTGILSDDLLNRQWGIQIDDFNFDGFQDIAIDTAYGYGGVNINSTIYAFDPVSGQFASLLDAMNINPNPQTKELFTGQKSGPRYYTTTYRFEAGKPWKYKDTTSMGYDLQLVVLYDKAGKSIQRKVVDLAFEARIPQTAKRTIGVERSRIFLNPVVDPKSKGYLVKGDQVEILDVSGEWDEWFKIRYQGEGFYIDRWIKSEDIAE